MRGISASGMQRLAHLLGIFELLRSHVRFDPEENIEGPAD